VASFLPHGQREIVVGVMIFDIRGGMFR